MRIGFGLWVLCLVLLCPGLAAADSAPLAVYGAGVMPIENKATRLVQQHVVVKLLPGDSPSPLYAYHHYECRVSARFELVSTVEETMLVGYPVGSGVFGESALPIAVDRIEVRVDGVVIDFAAVSDTFAASSGMSGERWIAWEMTFPPGQSRLVQIDYTVPVVLPRLTARVPVMYVLRTGAGWLGPIGLAHIRLDSPIELSDEDGSRLTPGYRLDDRGAIWEFLDLEPDFNIKAAIDNPLVRRDLETARSLAVGNVAAPGDAPRAARVLAAIVHELHTGGGGDEYMETLGLAPGELEELVTAVTALLSDSETVEDVVALITLIITTDGDAVRLFSLIEQALVGGADLSWLNEQELAQIAARTRASSDCREQDSMIARSLSHLVAGWAEIDERNCLVVWDDVVDRSGRVTSVVRVSIYGPDRSMRLISAGFPPVINVRWSMVGPRVSVERTICPERMGALACSALVYSLVGPKPGARELAADVLEFAGSDRNRASIQYGVALPRGTRLDGEVPPGYIDAHDLAVTVRASWARYPLLWPIALLIPVLATVWVIWRRRKLPLNQD